MITSCAAASEAGVLLLLQLIHHRRRLQHSFVLFAADAASVDGRDARRLEQQQPSPVVESGAMVEMADDDDAVW